MGFSAANRYRAAFPFTRVTAFIVLAMFLLPSTVRAESPAPRALLLTHPSLPDYDAQLGSMLRQTLAGAGYGYELVPVTVDALRQVTRPAPMFHLLKRSCTFTANMA